MSKCELCGEPMPAGEEMFKYHGYSGDCPKPPMPRDDCDVTGQPGPLPETGWDEVPADALNRALTQRPAAQTEREDFEAWLRTKPEARLWNTTDAMLAAYQAGRASLPAPQQAEPATSGWIETSGAQPAKLDWSDPQQATPEPVGEHVGTVVRDTLGRNGRPWLGVTWELGIDLPDGTKLFTRPAPVENEPVGEPVAAWRWFNSNGDQVTNWLDFKAAQKANVEAQVAEAGGRIEYAYTRPAPGVPEGFALVPMTEDQVWHNDSIMSANAIGGLKMDAVMRIVRGVEAHHSERLAAAQAKGVQV